MTGATGHDAASRAVNARAMDDPGLAMYARRTSCPCCGVQRTRAREAVVSEPRAERLPPDAHTGFVSGYAARRVFFSYFRCDECGAFYCPVFYTPEQLQALYGYQSENMGNVPLPARQRTQQGYADLAMRYSSGRGGFLEIGSDIGLFGEACASRGRFDHFWLYEPNLAVHAELEARFRHRPHAIHREMWPTQDVANRSCSTAALIHVLDHLLDPAAFLGAIGDKLEDDGVILTVTHNTASLLARVLGRRWPPYALQHPQLYSPAALTRLFDRAGYEVLHIAGAINHFPVMHLVRAAMSVCGLPAAWPNAAGPTIPLPLGNIAVVARKRPRR